jgi:two-component system, NarL family, nitrate/nitrite response regulator NarL
MEGDWLAGARFCFLERLHHDLPPVRILVVGDAVKLSTLARALESGVWGYLVRERAHSDIEHAIRAISQGELWLSRCQLSHLLLLRPAAEDFPEMPQLTPRENAVVRVVLAGYSNKEIACRLDIAEHTVAVHLHNIYGKLNVRGRYDLLIQHGGHGENTKLREREAKNWRRM